MNFYSNRNYQSTIYFLKLINPLKFAKPIKCQCCPHIETSQLICTANQLAGFYMRITLALNGLIQEMKFRNKPSQPVFTCSKLTIETLDQGVKYVQSYQ